jgi:predicted metal-dependent hydrolase
VEYALKRSRRAKYIHLRVQPGGVVVLTVPWGMAIAKAEAFVRLRAKWLARAIQRMAQVKQLPVSGRRDYLKHKEAARALMHERVAHWNQFYKFSYQRIAIKNTRRTWGSCSRKGNINFSYKLLFLPRELADYVVVHELCHLKHHNHGALFWAEVARTLPDYTLRRKELRTYLPSR